MVDLYEMPLGRADIDLASLVLQAAAIEHEVVPRDNLWNIALLSANVNMALWELTAYREENRFWPPAPPAPEPLAESWEFSYLLLAALAIFYGVTGPWQGDNGWFTAGALASGKVLREGQWWRLLTALTLHVDASHLLGNVLFGGAFLFFLAQEIGGGIAALAALVSGGVGNWLNILWRHGEHLSVGFSTAVFGLVGAFCLRRLFRGGILARDFILSVGAALALLAMLGTSGERSDVGAHIWGLVVGSALGALSGLPMIHRWAKIFWLQAAAYLIFVVVIWLSWYLALTI